MIIGKGEIVNNPHDKLFKETMTRRENALSFFREYLPADVVSQADWRTLRIVKETFVEPELKERFSDVAYEVRLGGRASFVYLLFEHQSRHDRLMPLRFHHYMGGLWDLWVKQNPGRFVLPAVVAILFYHGREKWSTGTQFQDMVETSPLTEKYVPKFEYVLRDLSEFGDEDVKGNVALRLFIDVSRRIFRPDFGERFDELLPLFAELSRKRTGMEYLETVLRYVYEVRDDVDPKETENKLVGVVDEEAKEGVVTVAEKLRKEGEIRGRIETCRELLAGGPLSREALERKLAELERKLREIGEEGREDGER